MNMRKKRNRYG